MTSPSFEQTQPPAKDKTIINHTAPTLYMIRHYREESRSSSPRSKGQSLGLYFTTERPTQKNAGRRRPRQKTHSIARQLLLRLEYPNTRNQPPTARARPRPERDGTRDALVRLLAHSLALDQEEPGERKMPWRKGTAHSCPATQRAAATCGA